MQVRGPRDLRELCYELYQGRWNVRLAVLLQEVTVRRRVAACRRRSRQVPHWRRRFRRRWRSEGGDADFVGAYAAERALEGLRSEPDLRRTLVAGAMPAWEYHRQRVDAVVGLNVVN